MRTDWGEPLDGQYLGDGLVDLHPDEPGRGTEWRRTPSGSYFPWCMCHCPASLWQEPAGAAVVVATAKADRTVYAQPEGVPPEQDPLAELRALLLRLLKP
jgi:hypothetical protein